MHNNWIINASNAKRLQESGSYSLFLAQRSSQASEGLRCWVSRFQPHKLHSGCPNPKINQIEEASKLTSWSKKVMCRSVFNTGGSPFPDRLYFNNKTSSLWYSHFKNNFVANRALENLVICTRLQDGQTYYQKPFPHFLFMRHFAH